MANFCIPKELIEQLKPRMKELGGAKLVSMSQQELTDFFAVTLGKNMAGDVAKSFRKATLSHKQDAMKQWAKKVLTAEEAKAVNKIADEMTAEDEVYDDIDGDVIEKVLGVTISPEEVDTINRLTEKMFEASKLEPDNAFSGYHSDYFKAQTELNNYLDTVNPMTNTEVLSRVIFRGNLLFGVKSAVTNVIGNLTGGITEKTVNTALERKFTGVNADLIKPYIQYALQTYVDSGIDVVRAMEATGATSVLGEHFKGIGDGKGALRAYGRFVEQYVLKMGQGTPDIIFASVHFADNVNVLSTKLADAKGLTGDAHKLEARRLFKLATSLRLDESNPEHAEALEIKRTAVQYALTATYQNDTQWSKNTLAIRNALDDYTGNLALGTNTVPFVKTLVNIAKLSIDMSGITLPIELPRLVYAYKKGDAKTMKATINVVIRAGLGMMLARLLAGLLDDDDFIPDYTIASDYQKEIAKLNNAPYNSIKIGNKWVSLAYFGTFGYALAGMLGARQQNTLGDKVAGYYKNTILQLRQTPIIQQVLDTYDYINESKKYDKSGGDVIREAIAGTAGFFTARMIPAIVGDVAKSFDDKERMTRYGFEGISDQLAVKIPFWREVLPPKYNALGDEIQTESWYWIILTGSRFKTAPSDDTVYKELTRLSQQGEDVSINLDRMTDVKKAKELLTDREFNELKGQLQKELSTTYANIMATGKYQNEEDPEKKKQYLMNSREKVVDRVLKQQGLSSRVEKYKKTSKKEDFTFETDKEIEEKNFIHQVGMYAEAMGVDPITAFKDLFAGETIRRIDNGTIIVHRMDVEDSQAVKRKQNADNEDYKLDHVMPLQLGGNNSESNLEVVPTSEWARNTPVENYLGKRLRNGTLSKKDAQEAMRAFKNGELTFEQIKEQY